LARCRELPSESGNAVVELALVVSFLGAPLMFATVDLSTLFYDSIEISNASHSAAMYGMFSASHAGQTSTMTTIAQADASDFVAANVTVTPTIFYACSNAQGGTQYSTSSAASSACTGSGNQALEFVQVVVSAPVTLPFSCCGLPASPSLSSTSVMQVEE
jgi:Flp pilus assembly protein TadG